MLSPEYSYIYGRGGMMERIWKTNSKAAQISKALFLMYFITGVLLFILAFLLFKLQLSEEVVTIGILVSYVLATFLGGLYIGKKMQNRKFLWGLTAGFLYFAILLLVTLAINRTLGDGAGNVITTMIMCVCGGTFGGMLA